MRICRPGDPVVGISLLTAACLIGDSMLYIALPLHFLEAGLDNLWQVGVLLSVNRFVRLPINPLVERLYRHLDLHSGLRFAALLGVLTTASYAFFSGFWLWLLARCVWGLAWTFLRLGAYFTILETASSANRGQVLGRYNGLYRLGSLFGMLLGGLMADFFGLRTTALLFAAITLCILPFAYPRKTTPQPNDEKKSRTQYQPSTAILRANPHILATLLTGACIAMVFQGMFTATLSHLIATHGTKTVDLGLCVIGAASLSGVMQALRWCWEPWLAPWFGRKSDKKPGRDPLLFAALILGGILFALIPQALPTAIWLLVIIGIQVSATALTTLSDAIASDAAASAPRQIMSLYSFLVDLGAALGPFLAYTLGDALGAYASCYGASLLLLALAAKVFCQWRRSHAAQLNI